MMYWYLSDPIYHTALWLTVYIFICLRTIDNMILLGIYSTVLLIHNYSIKSIVIASFTVLLADLIKFFSTAHEFNLYNVFSFYCFV